MSIYATLWFLKFQKSGDWCECSDEWVTVTAQAVPPFIGSPNFDYPRDPYEAFLPPPLYVNKDGTDDYWRAVVFVKEGTLKGTRRSGQEYVNPLLVISGKEYAETPFEELHNRICWALEKDAQREAGSKIK